MGFLRRVAMALLVSFFFISNLVPLLVEPVQGLPLSTRARWIVNDKGQRVRLACVNWVAHLDPVVVEGLSKQPVDMLSNKIKQMGFNCVRLTWPVHLATNESLASLTVSQSFTNLGLSHYISGIQANNPSFGNRSLINAFQKVVASLGKHNVMVILDNHASKPGWCCSYLDGDGFFGDKYFNSDLWLKGLTKMATLFKNYPHVVGMSIRNELRGPNQNSNDWYRYMQRGAEVVHSANPNVLVILSGLTFDTNLSFLHKQHVNLSFSSKLVFEVHWYAFTDGEAWSKRNANQVCGSVVKSMMKRAGFLLDQGFPLFLSEFGMSLIGTNDDQHRYINCLLAWAAEHDLDWALWTLVGSYYVREGVVGLNETFGVLDWTWSKPKNSSFLQKLSLLQSHLQGPGLAESKRHHIIFHPETGLCVERNTTMDHSRKTKRSSSRSLKLGPCSQSDHWSYTSHKTITIKGTLTGLQAQGLHHLVRISPIKSEPGMRWEQISDSKLHLSAKLGDNIRVCLDVDSHNNIITTHCKCLSGDHKCDPGNQWFKIVHVSG